MVESENDDTGKMGGEVDLDADDLVSRLRGEPGDCAFCGRDPYEYVDNGVGMERVAVSCCDEGIALYQHGDEVLIRQVQLRYEAADEIERLRAKAPVSGGGAETGWLVESDVNGPFYHQAGGGVTRNAADGLRFCRRQDAEAFIRAYGPNHYDGVLTPAWKAVEHRWG